MRNGPAVDLTLVASRVEIEGSNTYAGGSISRGRSVGMVYVGTVNPTNAIFVAESIVADASASTVSLRGLARGIGIGSAISITCVGVTIPGVECAVSAHTASGSIASSTPIGVENSCAVRLSYDGHDYRAEHGKLQETRVRFELLLHI